MSNIAVTNKISDRSDLKAVGVDIDDLVRGLTDGTKDINVANIYATNFTGGGSPSNPSLNSLMALAWSTGQPFVTMTAVNTFALLIAYPFKYFGTANYFAGIGAGAAWTIGTNNIGAGTNVLYRLTTGNNNVAIGNSALSYGIDNEENVAIGNSAMDNATNGACFDNVAVGYQALGSASHSTYCTAIGAYAMRNNNVDNNIGIGYYGLRGANTIGLQGVNNLGIGNSSGNNLYTGGQNVLIGNSVGSNLSTGSDNVAIGFQSMFCDFSLASGNNNICIGTTTGHDFTTSANNVLLGYNAGHTLSTGSGNVFIGYQAGQAVASTTANSLIIANAVAQELIKGTFAAAPSNATLQFLAKVGIIEGGASPQYYTYLQGGDQSADVTYTLPTALPNSSFILQCTSGGTLSWITAPTGGSGSVTTSTLIPAIVLTAATWSSTAGFYEFQYSNALILSASIVDAIPRNTSYVTVQAAQLLPSMSVSAGQVNIFANYLPAGDITMDMVLQL